jgi:hypothetical protein
MATGLPPSSSWGTKTAPLFRRSSRHTVVAFVPFPPSLSKEADSGFLSQRA